MRAQAGNGEWTRIAEAFRGKIRLLIPYFPELESEDTSTTDLSLAPEAYVAEQSALFDLACGLVRLLEEASTESPILVTIDDIQWADEQSLGVLKFFARNLASVRVFLLIGHRSEDPSIDTPVAEALGDLIRLTTFERHRLDELSKRDVDRCVHHIIGASVTVPARERIFALTKGHPLLVVQLCYALQERYRGAEVGVKAIEDLKLLQGISSLARQQLTRVPRSVVDLLETAALLGHEFTLRRLIEVSDSDSDSEDAGGRQGAPPCSHCRKVGNNLER